MGLGRRRADGASAPAGTDGHDHPDPGGGRGAHLVATSYGGFFALRTAAAHPERVQRLVEYGWTLGVPMAKLPAIMRVASLPGLRRALNAVPPTRGAVRALLGQIGLSRPWPRDG